MLDRYKLTTLFDGTIERMESLCAAWQHYDSEMFMAGKVEAAELLIGSVKKLYNQLLEAFDE